MASATLAYPLVLILNAGSAALASTGAANDETFFTVPNLATGRARGAVVLRAEEEKDRKARHWDLEIAALMIAMLPGVEFGGWRVKSRFALLQGRVRQGWKEKKDPAMVGCLSYLSDLGGAGSRRAE